MGTLTGSSPHVVVALGHGHDDIPLLAAVCLTLLGRPVTGVSVKRTCPRCGGDDHGRPSLRIDGEEDRFSVSISRCDGTTGVAVSDAAGVGLDLESPRRAGFAGFDDVVLHALESAPQSERDRAVVWARKEAYLKAVGTGLDADPRDVRLSSADAPPRVLVGVRSAVGIRLADLDDELVPAGLVGCVAVASPARPRVTVVTAGPEGLPRAATPGRAGRGPRRTVSPRRR
ncbi:4'-phosphopantetheinyl transferase family protein [Nocardioides iriomotensis]|uniref:4'-phosphopantetheinyl transferase family protein n=1 Tax=Nocardioides iriomotensis TaxID=715784 RepID=UPI0013EAF8B5|nr:4'-phosphopantetheinyl transferase superfamily protein [Nocardioides iriomotensis]